jgi:hypothetical protein
VATGRLHEKLEVFQTNYLTQEAGIRSLSPSLVENAELSIKEVLEEAIDKMKTTARSIPAIFIGGGALVVPTEDIKGTSQVLSPEHFEVGGAIGTTIAEIGAYAEGVVDLEREERQMAIEKVTEQAKDHAVAGGAIRETIEVVDVEETPFTYMPGKREKIRVRVKGRIFQ